MLRFLAGAWWALWHPGQALQVLLVALLWLIAPEAALMIWLLFRWTMHENERRLRAQLRVIEGPGFTMRDLTPQERGRRGLV